MRLEDIECCNTESSGRVYSIGDNSFLIYTECPICERPIAEIKTRTKYGVYKTLTRRTGEAAEALYRKYGTVSYSYTYKVHSGTKAREYEFTNKFGVVYNGNGVKIADQSDFLNMSRLEVNAIINRRFYKSKIAK